jgi:hypothetical protein
MSKGDVQEIKIKEFDPCSMPMSCTLIAIGGPGSGKCLAYDTPVLMYDGSVKKVQNIKAGELLMGDDSTSRTVLSTTSGRDRMFKIIPDIGEPYTVNEPHILCLQDHFGNIIEMSVKQYIDLTETQQQQYKGYRVGVDFIGQPIPFDPYFFGYWLGSMLASDEGSVYTFPGEELINGRIPPRYLINDRPTRLALLAGILDSAGYYVNNGYGIHPSNEKFFNDVIFLVRSLGLVCHTATSIYYSIIHILGLGIQEISAVIRPPNIPTYTPDLTTTIKVEYVGEGDYYGFELDGNHRFLLGDFTVTHNTTLIENFAYHNKHRYPVARVFIATEDGYKRFSKIFHPLFVSNYWDEKECETAIARQRKCLMDYGKEAKQAYSILIMDDISDDPKIYKTKLMKGIFKLGSQHWAQLVMIGTQYAIDFPPEIRQSVSYVALARQPELTERKKLYDNFGGLCGSFERFCDLMDGITGDYTFLIFKKRSQSNELEECVFWYRTTKLDDWKFGCKEYRAWGEARYDTNYTEQIFM